jgi:glyoxylase-like metal-dependent hydrolase (beta-lactamase superfamily II)
MGKLSGMIVPVTPFQQNCAILWDDRSRQAVVVDPGGDVDRIVAAIDQTGALVERIWLTHGHLDHAGGAAELQEALRRRVDDPSAVPIEGPDRRDGFLLAGLEAQGQGFGVALRNVTPDRWLAEGDSVAFGGHRFDVLHCPGHTPGHVVFVNRTARFALVGDVLFQGSVGRTDFPYGDHAALITAIKEKLLPLGDDFAFLCGHGPGSTIAVERRSNPFLR